MKTVYPDENNVVLYENSVERKPCINRESKSLEITIKLYSFNDINIKFLVVLTPPSIYQNSCPPVELLSEASRKKTLHLDHSMLSKSLSTYV